MVMVDFLSDNSLLATYRQQWAQYHEVMAGRRQASALAASTLERFPGAVIAAQKEYGLEDGDPGKPSFESGEGYKWL